MKRSVHSNQAFEINYKVMWWHEYVFFFIKSYKKKVCNTVPAYAELIELKLPSLSRLMLLESENKIKENERAWRKQIRKNLNAGSCGKIKIIQHNDKLPNKKT